MIESIQGVDHVGIGVRDIVRMSAFYRDTLGFNRVLAEMPEEDHPAIRGLIRAPRAIHTSRLLSHDGGELTVALFHATEPTPRPIRSKPRYGDIGVAKLTFAVPDIPAFCRDNSAFAALCFEPKTVALDNTASYSFIYGKDPEGNFIEIVAELDSTPQLDSAPQESTVQIATSSGEKPQGASSAGSLGSGPIFRSIGIAVTDLDRSLAFYREVLGFDRVLLAPHRLFSGLLDEVTGESGSKIRSCLLASSRGRGMLELFEVEKPRGRSIPFSAQWGDFGYLQVCLNSDNPTALAAQIESEKVELLLPFQTIDDPEHPGVFMYMQDPDGILIEIVAGL